MRKSREATALPKLEDVIRCRRLRWLGHLSQMDYHRLLRQAGNARVSEGGQVDCDRTGKMCQERSQENGHQLGRGCRGCGGQEELEESCRPMRLWCGMNQEPEWEANLQQANKNSNIFHVGGSFTCFAYDDDYVAFKRAAEDNEGWIHWESMSKTCCTAGDCWWTEFKQKVSLLCPPLNVILCTAKLPSLKAPFRTKTHTFDIEKLQ